MHDELHAAFRQMFGVEKVYDFQMRVAQHLLYERKSVILQAPTGSGKTWTALFPFLHAWQTDQVFPRKCLYAILTQRIVNNSWHSHVAASTSCLDKST